MDKYSANRKVSENLEMYSLIISFIMIAVFITTLAIFSGGQSRVNEQFSKATFYFIFGTSAILLLYSLKIGEITIRGKNELEKKYGFFYAYVFDPDKSILSNIPGFRWLNSLGDQFVIGFSLFAVLAILAQVSNTFLAVPQSIFSSISSFGSIYLISEPASSAETFMMMSVYCLLCGFAYMAYKRGIISKPIFYLLIFLPIPLFIGFLGMVIHTAVYGSKEVNLFVTFVFWTLSAIITSATGSILWAWLAHFFNNLGSGLHHLYTVNEVAWIIGTIVFLLNLIYWTTKYQLKQKKKKSIQPAGTIF